MRARGKLGLWQHAWCPISRAPLLPSFVLGGYGTVYLTLLCCQTVGHSLKRPIKCHACRRQHACAVNYNFHYGGREGQHSRTAHHAPRTAHRVPHTAHRTPRTVWRGVAVGGVTKLLHIIRHSVYSDTTCSMWWRKRARLDEANAKFGEAIAKAQLRWSRRATFSYRVPRTAHRVPRTAHSLKGRDNRRRLTIVYLRRLVNLEMATANKTKTRQMVLKVPLYC